MKRRPNIFRAVPIAAAVVGVLAEGSPAAASPVQFGANYYEFVFADSISWADANAAAAAKIFSGVHGHLATITSAAENDFLANSVADFSAFQDLLAIAWLGGWVNSTNIASWVVGPEAGQQFSMGQTAINGMYTNWGPPEPNNAPSGVEMQVGTLNWYGITHGMWADARNGLSSPCPGFCDPIVGYFVEYETPSSVPLPTAFPLFATGLGALGLIGWRRKRRVADLRSNPTAGQGFRTASCGSIAASTGRAPKRSRPARSKSVHSAVTRGVTPQPS